MCPETMCSNGDSYCGEEAKDKGNWNVLPFDFSYGKEVHGVNGSQVKATDEDDVLPDDLIPLKGVKCLIDGGICISVHFRLQTCQLFIFNKLLVRQVLSIDAVWPLR